MEGSNKLGHSKSMIGAQDTGVKSDSEGQPDSNVTRQRRNTTGDREGSRPPGWVLDEDFEMLHLENSIEANRVTNNYMFGFKKWKSHVTDRPLNQRSETVQEIYAEQQLVSKVSVCIPGNIIYVILIGWWVSLIYLLIALLMLITVIGYNHAKLCFELAKYFIWPFGKFVLKEGTKSAEFHTSSTGSIEQIVEEGEHIPLVSSSYHTSTSGSGSIWKRPVTYIWLLLGFLPLTIVHCVVFLVTWLPIIFIPVAKINVRTIRDVLLSDPERIIVSFDSFGYAKKHNDVILYIHHAVNVYYYKYTIDGANIIPFNMLIFVLFAMGTGYGDPDNVIFDTTLVFFLSLLAIIPLAYFVGLCITRIAASTNCTVGALLNATFGSFVEIFLYILSLYKGNQTKNYCYAAITKASIVGSVIADLLLVPGICMVVGGIRHSIQKFNKKSTMVTSTLLFVSVVGVFGPTIFTKTFGSQLCWGCENLIRIVPFNETTNKSVFGIDCAVCHSAVFGSSDDKRLYNDHILHLIYTCATLLPITYVIGMVYSLKTHKNHIHEVFTAQIKEENEESKQESHSEKVAHWSLIKSAIILFVAAALIALVADIITEHIMDVVSSTGLSAYFFGATLMALIPEIPEIINGVQFALQKNVALSIEIGTSAGIQVCMLQIPILVLIDAIYPMGFYMLFEDIHFWATAVALLVINYIFQDGNSDYFHGTALIMVYVIFMAMYYFSPNINACV